MNPGDGARPPDGRYRAAMDDHDLGDAAHYIEAERPGISSDDIWAVLNEVGRCPAPAAQPLAEDLVRTVHPHIRARTVRTILNEWRAFQDLEESPDWDDLEDD